MIVNINLLPQREKRNIAPYIILIVFILVAFFIILSFYVMNEKEVSRKEEKQRQLQVITTQLINQNKSQQSSESQSDETKLQSSVNELKESTISSVFIVDQLTQLLPEYGVFQSINYENEGMIDLQIQFNEKREAIYYFARLQKQNWIAKATITSINEEEFNSSNQLLDKIIDSRYIGNYQIEINKEKAKKPKEDAK